jgi:hypothetical protein
VVEETKLVCVLRCYGLDLAHIYKSKLDAAEIPALLQYDSAGPVFGITVDGMGQVRIMVPEPFAAEAKELLVDIPDDQLEEEDSLPDDIPGDVEPPLLEP